MSYSGLPLRSIPTTAIPERGIPGWIIIVIPPPPPGASARWIIVGSGRNLEAGPPTGPPDRLIEIGGTTERGIGVGGQGREVNRPEQDREVTGME